MNPWRRWAPAVRVARREAVRAKGRSALVLGMIALPVLGVTAADVVISTSRVSGTEAIERRLGTADARLVVEPGLTRVKQTVDPDTGGWTGDGAGRGGPVGLEDLAAALGRDLAAVQVVDGSLQPVLTDAGVTDVSVVETDLTDDLTDGLYRITEGRVAETTDEVVVNGALAARGFEVGDPLEVRDGPTLVVVGIGENTTYRGSPIAVAPLGSFDLGETGARTWLVDAGGDITWDDVVTLNGVGALVLSRAVLLDPPPDSAIDPELGWATSTDDAVVAVIALVVVMALLEVVLLAGPAFAVIARRMQRSLALMAATGATPPQARRVVLASGLVLGATGSTLGIGLGLVLAWLSLPVVQRFSDGYLGPYDVPWLHLVGIAGFGLLSALLAAVVPAWISSRQDVVSVLAGRRGDSRPSLRSPLLGVLLLAGGIAISAYGATTRQNGEYFIAVSAIVAVLGMILLVPVVVVGLAKLARGLPLPLRYAVRDASRHRTRTVPAVAAVAATVAGVVALGIANASDAAESEATYTQNLSMGQAALTTYGARPDWDGYRAVAERYLPGAQVAEVRGVRDSGGGGWTEVGFRSEHERYQLSSYGSSLGSTVLIAGADGAVPAEVVGLDGVERARAEAALADGGAVVFVNQDTSAEEVRLVVREYSRRGRPRPPLRATVPATMIRVSPLATSFRGVLSVEAAAAVGVEGETVGLLIDGAEITEAQELDVQEALTAIAPSMSFYVERGYEADDETVIVLLVLGALGAVLMLGGTLTATFLSLSDARPDLATLAAVGASPRTRRAVAASYAGVIGLVGAVLGAAVGFIPGVAVTYPLTGWAQDTDPSLPSHYLDVPWLLIGSLVLVLPLLTAIVVALCTRSRLPLVARVD
ncbi:MAG: FtsX-like permease family protein [Nocardioides sp.]